MFKSIIFLMFQKKSLLSKKYKNIKVIKFCIFSIITAVFSVTLFSTNLLILS